MRVHFARLGVYRLRFVYRELACRREALVPSAIRCPFCRREVPAGRVTCPYCSNRLPDSIRQQVIAEREEERKRREAERARVAAERAAAQQRVQTTTAEVETMNKMLDEQITALQSLLSQSLAVDDHLETSKL